MERSQYTCSMHRNGLFVSCTYFSLYLYRLNVRSSRSVVLVVRHIAIPYYPIELLLVSYLFTTRPDVTGHNAYLGQFLGLFVFRSCLSPLPEVGEIAKGKSSCKLGGKTCFCQQLMQDLVHGNTVIVTPQHPPVICSQIINTQACRA